MLNIKLKKDKISLKVIYSIKTNPQSPTQILNPNYLIKLIKFI